MQIDARPIDLRLTTPFRISRGVQNVASNAIVQINFNGHTGYGEAAPDEFYGENVETVLACISQFAGNLGDDPFVIEDVNRRPTANVPGFGDWPAFLIPPRAPGDVFFLQRRL